jgi:SAM-dependent methyltransferase
LLRGRVRLMHFSIVEFFVKAIDCMEFNGKRVIEIGSNSASVKPLIEKFCNPAEYIGTDIAPGKYVDIILPAEKLVEHFGVEAFDVVISTETIEHVLDWRTVINNMKAVLKRGGYVYLTTRSRGFPYHGAPYDFWRYEPRDIIKIFRDFEIVRLEADWEAPGIFLKARKPFDWKSVDLQDVALYSIVFRMRVKSVEEVMSLSALEKLRLILCSSKIKALLPGALAIRLVKIYCT